MLIKRGMSKINANLLLTNMPEYGETPSGYDMITSEILHRSLEEFGEPNEVIHLCRHVYIANVKDPKSYFTALSENKMGNKIGKNTIEIVEYDNVVNVNSTRLPHENFQCHLDVYYPIKKITLSTVWYESFWFLLFIVFIFGCVIY